MQLSSPQRAHGVLHTRPIRARGPHLEAANDGYDPAREDALHREEDERRRGACGSCGGRGGNCPECSGWEGDEEEEAVPAIATAAWPMPQGKALPAHWSVR